jgi:hypothetical protein
MSLRSLLSFASPLILKGGTIFFPQEFFKEHLIFFQGIIYAGGTKEIFLWGSSQSVCPIKTLLHHLPTISMIAEYLYLFAL